MVPCGPIPPPQTCDTRSPVRVPKCLSMNRCARFRRMNTRAFEEALQRQAIFEIAVGLIVLIALFWATYWVIKAGVRDGIIEAGPRCVFR